MKLFTEYIRLNLKVSFQYKRAFLIMCTINCAVALIYLPLFKSIYSYNATNLIKGYNLTQMVWYFVGATIVGDFVFTFTDLRLSRKILSGDMSVDLLKPVSVFKTELASIVGQKVLVIIIQILLPFLICSTIIFPNFITLHAILRFIILNIFGFSISFLINYIIGLSAFYLKDNNSIIRLKSFLIGFTGGAFIPLEFFPAWSNRILEILPFKYIYYWPIQFFLNTQAAKEQYMFFRVILVQISWIAILLLLAHLYYRKAIKSYCGVGS